MSTETPPPVRTQAGRKLYAGLALAAALGLLALGAREGRSLFAFYQTQERLPLWDMAGHGWGGVELAQSLAQGAPLQLLDRLNRQDKWPFGYSLLLLPFFAAQGPTFAAATLLSTVLFALVPALLLWAAWEVDRGPAGIVGGALAGIVFLTAPLPRVLAIVIMRETAGVAATALALALYLRARRRDTPGAWRAAGLATLALVFLKVNYALLWVAAVALVEFLALPAEGRRDLLLRSARLLWPGRAAPRWRIALAVALGLIALCALAGLNIGIGLYALLWIFTLAGLRWIYLLRRQRESARSRWRELPSAVRQIVLTLVLPLWIWSLSPDPIHPKEIFAFLKNRSAGPPLLSGDSLLFYPRVFVEHFAAAPWLGAAVLALALLGAALALVPGMRQRLERGEPGTGRGLALLATLAFLGLLLATAHPYKEPRFLATTAPFLMLLAGVCAGRLAFACGWGPRSRAAIGAVLSLAAIAAITASAGLLLAIPPAERQGERLAQDYKLYSSGRAFRRPLLVLSRWARGSVRIGLIGTFNELSDSLIRWSWVQEDGYGAPAVAAPIPRFRADLPLDAARGKLARWIAEERPDRILALRLLPESPRYSGQDFATYNAWQLTAVRALETNPAWTITRRRTFPAIDVEALLFEWTTAQAE